MMEEFDIELAFNEPFPEELLEHEKKLQYSEEAVTHAQFFKAQQFHAEKLLLHKIFEQASRRLPKADETEDELDSFYSGYCEGFSEALDAVWDVIEEHIENNEYEMRKW
jgi:hypothetical protein